MKLSINHKLISRNKKISQYVLYASLAMLVLGFVWSLKNQDSQELFIAYTILVPAYILVQISIRLANKWGRSPRPDEIVASSLKGLNNDYTLYTYTTGVPHLLVGPAGTWIINPCHQSGTIIYNPDKKRYKQENGPGFFAKLFAQEGLPDIAKDTENLVRKYHTFNTKNNITIDLEPKVINLFFSDEVSLQTKNAPDLLLLSGKIKDFLRQTAKKANIKKEEIKVITDQLPDVTD